MNRWIAAAALIALPFPAPAQDGPSLGLPIDCTLGETCFVQQYPDMDGGPASADPFCGSATYDGHKGTDIRIRYMTDVAKDVPVLAAAGGTVLRLRDGVADRAIRDDADRKRVANLECGNGVVIGHGGGWETQYCHLKRGSIAVREGQQIRKGEKLGAVGASGLAQFPHVHISVRKDGKDVDPFSGKPVGTGCDAEAAATMSLWDPALHGALSAPPLQLLDAGFASGPVDGGTLLDSPPLALKAGAGAYVGWANLINLRKGDRITVTLLPPGGEPLRNAADPLDRNKATYMLFAGKRGAPPPGAYHLRIEVLRDGKPVLSETRETTLR